MDERNYEVALMRRVSGGVEDDFVSMGFEPAVNYAHARKIAKIKSMEWDACDVIMYYRTKSTEYSQCYRETYVKGKNIGRIYF